MDRNGSPMNESPPKAQLYTVHRVMIGAAIALCALLVPWGVFTYRDKGDVGALVLAAGAGLFGAALTFYLRRFLRRTRSQ